MSGNSLPNRAKIVIIGGGVGGTSVAYHLAELGERDVVLLDRSDLTSGSTFHSAGLVGQLRADPTLTKMNMHSVDLYRRLEKSDTPPGWKECGSIKIASTKERMQEIRRQIGWAKNFGLDLHEISLSELKEKFPLLNMDGIVGACIMKSDGQVDPSQLALALASGARKLGVQIHTHTRVLSIATKDNRVSKVVTDKGEIECEIVVNCGGMFAAEIARMVGVRVPIVPMSHQYLITENFLDQNQPMLPSLRDPDNLIYFRQEVAGLVMGGYERNSKAWSASESSFDAIPADFNGKLLSEDWDRFEEIAENASKRIPAMADLGFKNFINGPEGFTPDNEFCLGETEVGGFYVAAGFCAHGIAGAGGIGKVVAEWIVAGEPTMDLWHMDIRRFAKAYESPKFTLARIKENYEAYYDIHYPGEERTTMRPHNTSPIYEWHKANGAVFGEKFAWERVNYYQRGSENESLRPKEWAGHHWNPNVVLEHQTTRTSAGLFDESSFAKIEISGARAGEFLNYVAANDVVRGENRAVYTQLLNSRGGIEADVTITAIAPNNYLLITGTASGRHDLTWLRKIAAEKKFTDLNIEDVTENYAVFGIWGPKAREIMSKIVDIDLSHKAFPFARSLPAKVAGIDLRMTRITYVGELGWEVYVSTKIPGAPLKVWEAMANAAAPFGALPCGYRAIESLRLEKGYRAWGVEISTETTPFEAGLGFAVSLTKPDFLGKKSLLEKVEPKRTLVALTFEDITQVPFGKEPIRKGEKIIGQIKSGGQGFTINKAIGYAYLPIQDAKDGDTVDVEFFGQWIPAKISQHVLFDPQNERVRS